MGRKEWYRSIWKGDREAPGCLSGMLHLFDFHHILLTTKTGSSRASSHNALPQLHHCHSQQKGVEAPRNSLELDEAAAAKATSTASALAEEYYGIPIGIQIKSTVPTLTKKKDLQLLIEAEKNSFQCETPRTPNAIARLMGLEILPDGASTTTKLLKGFKSQDHSPKISGTNKKMSNRKPLQKLDTNLLGSRSLPDTPRASSERVRDSDPRFSLQINKENKNNNNNNIYNNRATHLCDVSHSLPPLPGRKDCYNKIQNEDNKSPRSHYYTREIVKQVKENINGKGTSNGVDENAITRSRTRVPTDKRVLVVENYDFVEFSKIRAPPKIPHPQSNVQFNVGENVEDKQKECKKASCGRLTEMIKRHPPTSEIATQSRVVLPNPISSACSNLRALPQNNNCTSEKIKRRNDVIATSTTRRNASYGSPLRPPLERTCTAYIVNPSQEQRAVQYRRFKKEQNPELLYLRSILEHAGIMNSPTQEVRWYSQSLPIDPFIFHQLELDPHLFHPQKLINDNLALLGPLRHRCNRKLLFHLVEEVLRELLTWSTSTKTQKRRLHDINKELLLERLWSQIKSFPQAYCQTIEDIDALVARDMGEAKVRHLLCHPLVVAEAEDIVLEIEEDVVDSIVAEAAASLAIYSKL